MNQKTYKVTWKETHEAWVEATSDEQAIAKAYNSDYEVTHKLSEVEYVEVIRGECWHHGAYEGEACRGCACEDSRCDEARGK